MPSSSSSLPILRPKPPLTGDELAQDLVHFARNSLLVLNNGDYDYCSPLGSEVLSRIAPDFQAYIDNMPGPLTFSEVKNLWRDWAVRYPGIKYVAVKVTADVNEEKGTAMTYMDMDVIALSNVDLKGIGAHKWRREKNGKWVVYEYNAMRGMHGNSGFVDGLEHQTPTIT